MNDLFLRACRREPVERTPMWIMRQAGRYLPEYRALRERTDFVTMCRTPELATEATLQPLDRFGLDAAILFSDILVPVESMGFTMDFTPGPVLDPPVRSMDDVRRIAVPETGDIAPYVYDAVRMLRKELTGRVPLIGFAAAPFTLAAYLVEGQGSKSFDRIKGLLFGEPEAARELMERVTTVTIRYLAGQVEAGVQAVQLFDSWAGLLSRAAYREHALPYARRVLDSLADSGLPRIYFALNNAHLLDDLAGSGADVVGMDWRLGLDEASKRLGDRFVLQGNLDPCVLKTDPGTVATAAREVLAAGAKAPGHVFNLGHGILPDTPIANVEALVRTVHEWKRDGGST